MGASPYLKRNRGREEDEGGMRERNWEEIREENIVCNVKKPNK